MGRKNRVYEVLSRRRTLTLRMIEGLHRKFGIPAESLLRQRIIKTPAPRTIISDPNPLPSRCAHITAQLFQRSARYRKMPGRLGIGLGGRGRRRRVLRRRWLVLVQQRLLMMLLLIGGARRRWARPSQRLRASVLGMREMLEHMRWYLILRQALLLRRTVAPLRIQRAGRG